MINLRSNIPRYLSIRYLHSLIDFQSIAVAVAAAAECVVLEQLDSLERSPELVRERSPSVADLDSGASRTDERRLQPFEMESSIVRDRLSKGSEPSRRATDAWEVGRSVAEGGRWDSKEVHSSKKVKEKERENWEEIGCRNRMERNEGKGSASGSVAEECIDEV